MSVIQTAFNEPVESKAGLVRYHEKGAKTKDGVLIGAEHEKFVLDARTFKPVPYEGPRGIQALLTKLSAFGHEPVMEGENIIGLTRGLAGVSLEPAGQFELSGAPFPDLHLMSAELDIHIRQAKQAADELGLIFLPVGYHPEARFEDMPWMPKGRYAVMRRYMPKKGNRGVEMMLLTCTTQANLDYTSEADMVKKMRVSLALQPVVAALFASSPFKAGKASGLVSNRCDVWQDVDPDRCGTLPIAFEADFGYERYVDFALDVPMYFVYRDGKYIDCAGQSFRDFLEGKLPGFPGEKPLLFDWINHLTTIYTDVRMKSYLEMRGSDVGPAPLIKALPALWTGLFYDGVALDAAQEIIKGWSVVDIEEARREMPRVGLNHSIQGQKFSDIAGKIVALAAEGLRKRARRDKNGADETYYLEPLSNLLETGQTEAERLCGLYHKEWGGDIRHIYKECRL